MGGKIASFILAFLIAGAIGVLIFFPLLALANYLFPAVVEMEGKTYRVMPIGQMLFSALVSFIVGGVCLFFVYRKLKRLID